MTLNLLRIVIFLVVIHVVIVNNSQENARKVLLGDISVVQHDKLYDRDEKGEAQGLGLGYCS